MNLRVRVLDPQLDSGGDLVRPSGIILHATAGSSVAGAISALRPDPERGRRRSLAYHWIVAKDGTVWACLDPCFIAHHAGSSYGWNEAARGVDRAQNSKREFIAGCSVNGYTLAISLVNRNDGRDPYPDEQRVATAGLIARVAARMPSLRWVASHAAVSPGRKSDPRGLDLGPLIDGTTLRVWRP